MATNKPFTILIADDDPDDLQYMKFLFEKHAGFELLDCLTTGKSILDFMDGDRLPNILLTDMYMPVMTGSEVVTRLLEKGTAPDTHIFIISTTINLLEQDKFRDSPNVKFLKKPVTLVEINDLPELILDSLNAKNINKI